MAGRGGSHGYCLKWKYHPNNLLHMFNQLLLNESFTDVLVACEGKAIKCHKMVLSACSKYFEQVFCEYPQQNSTLVILKDMKFADVQAIVEFMYQGEINVAHDQLASLLRAAESLQVKGLADITGPGGGSSGGAAVVNNKDESDLVETDSGPPSPPSVSIDNSEGSVEASAKRKRGRPAISLENMSDGISLSMAGGDEEFSIGSILESHFSLGRGASGASNASKNARGRRKLIMPSGVPPMADEAHDDDDDEDMGEEDEVTEDDVAHIVKMTEYIEKGGSRPQFWDEPTTKKIMNAIRSKKMEMKAAAELLGVSYSTLYSRYRELHGYLKMPHTQDTNFNYYQVLNLLRAGQITLQDAAKRLNIHEKTLGSYLSSSGPKKPRLGTSSSELQFFTTPAPQSPASPYTSLHPPEPPNTHMMKDEYSDDDSGDEDKNDDLGDSWPNQ